MPNAFQRDSWKSQGRKFVYKLLCPVCGHVGAMIVGYDAFDPQPNGLWKCCKEVCGHEFAASPSEELTAVPVSQLSEEFR